MKLSELGPMQIKEAREDAPKAPKRNESVSAPGEVGSATVGDEAGGFKTRRLIDIIAEAKKRADKRKAEMSQNRKRGIAAYRTCVEWESDFVALGMRLTTKV